MASNIKGLYRIFGWNISPYSQKMISYLQYKQIPHVVEAPNFYQLFYTFQKKTNARVIPILQTPNDEWIQDSKVMIMKLEKEYPNFPILPQDPTKRFLSCLIETWSDEVWPSMAMHTRWSYPQENLSFFEEEVGKILLPYLPSFVQRKAANKVAQALRKIMFAVGVRPSQFDLLHTWSVSMLDALDVHFQQNKYLLGGNEPTIGDFSLVGWFHAHLNYDPWPKQHLMNNRIWIQQWETRMFSFHKENRQVHSKQDQQQQHQEPMPETLKPVLRVIAKEFVPQLQEILKKLMIALQQEKFQRGERVPRKLGDIGFPIGPVYDDNHGNKGPVFYRQAIPFSLWKAQLVLDEYHAMSPQDKATIEEVCEELGLTPFLQLQIPRLEHHALRVRLVK